LQHFIKNTAVFYSQFWFNGDFNSPSYCGTHWNWPRGKPKSKQVCHPINPALSNIIIIVSDIVCIHRKSKQEEKHNNQVKFTANSTKTWSMMGLPSLYVHALRKLHNPAIPQWQNHTDLLPSQSDLQIMRRYATASNYAIEISAVA